MKKIIAILSSIILALSLVPASVFATAGPETFAVETAILKSCGDEADKTNGEGIECILMLVVDILTAGVGIVSVLGIGIAGVQYLTAGGSEEQTRKAKRRIAEIVIGLAAYVLIYAFLRFILPGFNVEPGSI